MQRIVFSMLSIILLYGCKQELPKHGSQRIVLFDKEHLHFNPEKYAGPLALGSNDLVRIADGRILLRKVSLPVYAREAKATLRITFSSAGDPCLG